MLAIIFLVAWILSVVAVFQYLYQAHFLHLLPLAAAEEAEHRRLHGPPPPVEADGPLAAAHAPADALQPPEEDRPMQEAPREDAPGAA